MASLLMLLTCWTPVQALRLSVPRYTQNPELQVDEATDLQNKFLHMSKAMEGIEKKYGIERITPYNLNTTLHQWAALSDDFKSVETQSVQALGKKYWVMQAGPLMGKFCFYGYDRSYMTSCTCIAEPVLNPPNHKYPCSYEEAPPGKTCQDMGYDAMCMASTDMIGVNMCATLDGIKWMMSCLANQNTKDPTCKKIQGNAQSLTMNYPHCTFGPQAMAARMMLDVYAPLTPAYTATHAAALIADLMTNKTKVSNKVNYR